MSNQRAELNLHTKLSDDVSIVDINDAIVYAEEAGFSALAFTNLNNVQYFPNIAPYAKKTSLKIICGAEVCYKRGAQYYHAVLLIKNQEGVKDLYKILSTLANDGVGECVDYQAIKENSANLLVGSCGNKGEVFHAVASGNETKALENDFFDFYEIYPTDDVNEQAIYKRICEIGGERVVAGSNCRYLTQKDELCYRVAQSARGQLENSKNRFLHTTQELLAELSYLGEEMAYSAVVTNSNRIAGLVEAVNPINEKMCLPDIKNAYKQMEERAFAKAKSIYGAMLPDSIEVRLKTELGYIKQHKFAAYYWVAGELVNSMRAAGYPVSTRGMVGSTLVSYLLGISSHNPLPQHYYCPDCHYYEPSSTADNGFDLPVKQCPKCLKPLNSDGHNIPFEIFMGDDGTKIPDIDINIPFSVLDEAIKSMTMLFGAENVLYAGAIRTVWERLANEYIAAYESKTGEVLTQEEKSYICEKLCGIKRSCGSQYGGFFVIPDGMEAEDFTPVHIEVSADKTKAVTHLDFKSLSNVIMKQDVLGFKALDILFELKKTTGKDICDIDCADAKIYDLFAKAETSGIPEFETEFMRGLLLQIKPKSFNELVKINGLAHGTGVWSNNAEHLIKDGVPVAEIPALRDDIFNDLLRVGADRKIAYKYSDIIRKGGLAGKRLATAERDEFKIYANKISPWYYDYCSKIWYCFPKSHSVEYTLNAARLAWFKVYYPTEFEGAVAACQK